MPAHINRQVFTIPLVFWLVLSGIACRKKIDPVFPGVTLPPATLAPVEPLDEPPQQLPPPTEPPPALPQPTVATPPPDQSKRPVRRTRPTTPATPARSPATKQPLRLGEMLTPEQERQYNTAMDRSLQRAQANIAVVSKRRLSKEQQGV